jgi:hypothetical protein
MLNRSKMKPWITIAAFFIALNTLFFYGFIRDGTWLVIAILLIPLYFRIGPLNFLISSLSFFFITVVLVFLIDYVFPQIVYYGEPGERLLFNDKDGLRIYKKNQDIQRYMPYGQLAGFSDQDQVFDIRSRDVSYRTDSLGFRNNLDYNKEKYILVGDSMIAGSGSSQENILSSQLKSKFNVNAYNVAIPGEDILGYVKNIKKFESLHHEKSFKILLFLAQSNDFENPKPPLSQKNIFKKIRAFHQEPLRQYKNFFKQTGLYRYTFSVYKSFVRKIFNEKAYRLFIGNVGSHKVAFLSPNQGHKDKIIRKKYSFSNEIVQGLESVKSRIEYIFFLPSKYSVYSSMIENNPYPTIPNVEWQALQSLGVKLGIPTENLTEAMVAKSRKLLKEKNEMMFWEDDAHWNGNGAEFAADLVCKTATNLGCSIPHEKP